MSEVKAVLPTDEQEKCKASILQSMQSQLVKLCVLIENYISSDIGVNFRAASQTTSGSKLLGILHDAIIIAAEVKHKMYGVVTNVHAQDYDSKAALILPDATNIIASLNTLLDDPNGPVIAATRQINHSILVPFNNTLTPYVLGKAVANVQDLLIPILDSDMMFVLAKDTLASVVRQAQQSLVNLNASSQSKIFLRLFFYNTSIQCRTELL